MKQMIQLIEKDITRRLIKWIVSIYYCITGFFILFLSIIGSVSYIVFFEYTIVALIFYQNVFNYNSKSK